MLAVIPFPDIGPDIFSIEIGTFTFALRWYAMAYIVGIIVGWRMGVYGAAQTGAVARRRADGARNRSRIS